MIRAAGLFFFALSLASLLMLVALAGAAQTPASDDVLGGQVRAEIDGRTVSFPLLKSEVSADIQGDLATVTIVQTFTNPTGRSLNASYLFPLNKDAAVFAMQMQVGDERIVALIKRREEATAKFRKAQQEGKSAALLTQHRPNMFTQGIANLMPGQPVRVTLQYAQTVPRIDGAYELVVPLIVGPRYNPPAPDALAARAPSPTSDADALRLPAPAIPQTGNWQITEPPAYPEVAGLTIPDTVDSDRVSITANLRSALPVKAVFSETHKLAISGSELARTVSLAAGRTIDNRDFVLRYALSGNSVDAGLLAHKDDNGGYFSLMIEPPAVPVDADITPRELVFVLDTSGSMAGEPIAASKIFMRHALKNLRPNDYFRIVRFSSNASEFTAGPVAATLENLVAGLEFVNDLHAGGGTEIPNAINTAFAVRQQSGTLRIVVFLSDGYIGNETEVLRQIDGVIGKARVYAFGVGTSVNRYLLAEMARHGRGFARFIDPTESAGDAAVNLARRLDAPILTDIAIDWGSLEASDVTPQAIPDLFKGGSIRIQGRYANAGEHTVTVHGRVNGRPARLPLKIAFPAAQSDDASRAIPLIWARTRIADAMAAYMAPRRRSLTGQSSTDQIRQQVTDLGLTHSLVTRWTSFIAVSQKIVNPEPALATDASVPLPMVKGVEATAYPKQAAAPAVGKQFAGNFSGTAAPEPESMLALLVIMFAGLFGLRRRLRIRGIFRHVESWR